MYLSVVDADLGNIKSIKRIVKHIGGTADIICEFWELARTEAVLPSDMDQYDYGMGLLHDGGRTAPLNKVALVGQISVPSDCLGLVGDVKQ